MRLFVALELPRPARTRLEQVQQQLRHGGSHPVRWVAPASIHLTLQFLGEVAESLVPSLLVALEQADISALPRLHLTEVGAFPDTRQPQVVWMGVGGEEPLLLRIQQEVVRVLEPHGFAPDKRSFRPHLTLGRVERNARTAQRKTLGTALDALRRSHQESHMSISWQSGPPLLFQSTLTPSGAIYRKLGPAYDNQEH